MNFPRPFSIVIAFGPVIDQTPDGSLAVLRLEFYGHHDVRRSLCSSIDQFLCQQVSIQFNVDCTLASISPNAHAHMVSDGFYIVV